MIIRPAFDKRGHPVEQLNYTREGEKIEMVSVDKNNKYFHRDRFVNGINQKNLTPPKKRKRSQFIQKIA